MKIISEANESVLTILKKFLTKSNRVRWIQYCVTKPVDEGMLVFNLLTRELILLTQEEYDSFSAIDYLQEHWFAVPESTKEKDYADLVKWVVSTRQKNAKEITGYTIFTTTDCNARCFYCFELKRSRMPMSCETAEKVVQYIKNHSAGKPVSISWFGGEPLYNVKAIDTIAEGLHKEQIPFRSIMISNGYLLDDEIVKRAVNCWNLNLVQITLDGTEQIYNKIKAYIYRDGNPYEIVMNNIGRLLDAGIRVSIRMNMDNYNAEDLLVLTEELAHRFCNKSGLSVYAHHLFKGDEPMAELHSEEEWGKRDKAMQRLTECIAKNGLAPKSGISKAFKLNHCMADSGRSVAISPDGNIGLCRHFSESEFVGHIDSEDFNEEEVAKWKERTPAIPECAECFFFLDCAKIKKCPNGSECYRPFRQEKYRDTQRAMLCEYQRWQKNSDYNEKDDDDTLLLLNR